MDIGLHFITILRMEGARIQPKTNRQYQTIYFNCDNQEFKGMYYLDTGSKLHIGEKILAHLKVLGTKEQVQGQKGMFDKYNTFFIVLSAMSASQENISYQEAEEQWDPKPRFQQQEFNTAKAEPTYRTTQKEQDPELPDWMNDIGENENE